MIKPVCDKCNQELQDYGAIIIGPPTHIKKEDSPSSLWMTEKYHICTKCYEELISWMKPEMRKSVIIPK